MDPSTTQKSPDPEPEPVTEIPIRVEPTWLQQHHHLDLHPASFNNTTGRLRLRRPLQPLPPVSSPPMIRLWLQKPHQFELHPASFNNTTGRLRRRRRLRRTPRPPPRPPQPLIGSQPRNYCTESSSVSTPSPDRPQLPMNSSADPSSELRLVPQDSDRSQEVPMNSSADPSSELRLVPQDSDRSQASGAAYETFKAELERAYEEFKARFERPFKGVGDPESWAIYEVPHRLRAVNEKAYEPNVISIGPYHFGKKHLYAMEVIKRSCFSKSGLNISEFRRAMEPLEEEVRKCYQKPSYLNSEEFVDMMVYDGCFIVQLIRKIYPDEDIFKVKRIQTDIRYDLLLLENQLPFSVLVKLYREIMENAKGDLDHEFAEGEGDLDHAEGDLDHEFACLALSVFKKEVHGGPEIWLQTENCPPPGKEIKHLLHLVHNCCRPSPQHLDRKAKAAAAKAKEPKTQRSWKFIRSATELGEAGINFFGEKVHDHDQVQGLAKKKRKKEGFANLFDIIFIKHILKIPTLHVDDNTDRILRNLMAYEQFIPSGEPTYVVDYVLFMDNLINTGKDVQILCNSGIIDNWLGDDEAVAQMFNKLRDFIYMSEDFYYAEIFGRVNEHCQRNWNKSKAILKKDYFNTPWSHISFYAAVVLLLLTLLQTIFSVLSYFNR